MIRKSKKEHHDLPAEGQPAPMPGAEEEIRQQQEPPANGEGGEPQAGTTPERSGTDPCSELNDKYLRLYSDFDNFRKRTLKEKIELSKFASEEVIRKLLPVLDDFDRALKAFETATGADQALKDGMVLIHNKFFSLLQQQGLQPMRAVGEPFDTDFHEAVTNIPAPKPEDKGKIVDVIEKGYLLHGKVIRFAKVVVGS